jgi:methylthioribose-1-phosphate isomerase
MKIQGQHFRTIWLKQGTEHEYQIIDQSRLPHEFVINDLKTVDDFAKAIRDMQVRGAILIGAAAAFGMHVAAWEAFSAESFDASLLQSAQKLKSTRPTAVNLAWAVDQMTRAILHGHNREERLALARKEAQALSDSEEERCRQIGEHGLGLIHEIACRKKGRVNILTHCNAGWLACVDYGSATAPMYAAFDQGLDIHVWVDETRPWNQGARLTAWELGQHGVPHTIVADNVGGHLMQHGMVDLVIVGSDRTTRTGDVANKIGTYLKALSAKDNNIPFYAALPSSTFDWSMRDGLKEIPIEERDSDEVKYISGRSEGRIHKVLLTPENSPAANYSFDVTPSRLITGIITERGVCPANEQAILELYPERR